MKNRKRESCRVHCCVHVPHGPDGTLSTCRCVRVLTPRAPYKHEPDDAGLVNQDTCSCCKTKNKQRNALSTVRKSSAEAASVAVRPDDGNIEYVYMVTRSAAPPSSPLHGLWFRMPPSCGMECGFPLPRLWGFWGFGSSLSFEFWVLGFGLKV